MGHAVVRISIEGNDEVPTVIKMLYVDNPTDAIDEQAYLIAAALNEFMQAITKGIPGSLGKLPA